jgi:hypothetical protein
VVHVRAAVRPALRAGRQARPPRTWLAAQVNEYLRRPRGEHIRAIANDFAVWRRRAGLRSPAGDLSPPAEAELARDLMTASSLWSDLGCPYEAALPLARADDESTLRHALTEFQRLGATAAAGIVARRPRALGARDLPRGPYRAARENGEQSDDIHGHAGPAGSAMPSLSECVLPELVEPPRRKFPAPPKISVRSRATRVPEADVAHSVPRTRFLARTQRRRAAPLRARRYGRGRARRSSRGRASSV